MPSCPPVWMIDMIWWALFSRISEGAAKELGVSQIVIPYSASVHGAFGLVGVHVHAQGLLVEIM